MGLLNISKRHIAPLLPLTVLLMLALFAPVISNNQPILIISSEGLHLPLAGGNPSGKEHIYFTLHPPIPYAPTDINLEHASHPPLSKVTGHHWYRTHWLGTDEIGRDVLANLLHGCRSSVLIAFGAMTIALTVGLILGAIGGFWHQNRIGLRPLTILIAMMMTIFLYNSAVVLQARLSSPWAIIGFIVIAVFCCSLLYGIHRVTEKRAWFAPKFRINISPDSIVVAVINFFTAIPGYFALLALLALWPEQTAFSLTVILGLLMWPDIARLTRSAVIKNRGSGWSESAQSLGFSPLRITFQHLLPNSLQPALVALSFGIGGAIMAESFLSFIGIAPAEMVSWGTMLAKVRSYPDLWWLFVFPGIAILIAILTFYHVAGMFETNRKFH